MEYINQISNDKVIVKNSNKKSEMGFFTSKAKLVFTKLRQVFNTASILHYFDLKCHIWIEINVPGSCISGILGQLTLDNLG